MELFAGAGGLAMGASLAGFSSKAVVEWDRWAADTIRENANEGFPMVSDWPLFEGDVRDYDYDSIAEKIDLVAGGPPCQPFSMGGKHRAHLDERDMFPAAVGVVRELRPRAFLFENVKGLTRSTFSNYFQYIILQLTFPEIIRRASESALDHFARLEKEKTSGKRRGLTYEVVFRVVNAANYGVPQKRERVFIVGFRHDIGVNWSFPDETHSYDALLEDQWISEAYWDRHAVSKRMRPKLDQKLIKRVEQIKKSNDRPLASYKPWRTVRDALVDMPDPRRNAAGFHNHKFQPGARAYPGHTGSPIDLPSKALKAGVHGVPGGENMMVLPEGAVRYFTVREAARLQTFPDGYKFHGSWSETMRQLGNAVPVRLGQIMASSVAQELALHSENELKRTIMQLAKA
ncbi:DNA cytosine methyltransferase [Thalassospiraceae bacterium LMO-JJ14]|nr:DNA cytosine methyltransferase [Thalassospiraceae bacterium LMO-JJ14]